MKKMKISKAGLLFVRRAIISATPGEMRQGGVTIETSRKINKILDLIDPIVGVRPETVTDVQFQAMKAEKVTIKLESVDFAFVHGRFKEAIHSPQATRETVEIDDAMAAAEDVKL